jgi:hypothetical protein
MPRARNQRDQVTADGILHRLVWGFRYIFVANLGTLFMTKTSKNVWISLSSTSIVNLMVGLRLLRWWRNSCNLAGPRGQTTKVSSTYVRHLAGLWSAVSSAIHRLRPPEAHLTLNGQNIPFVNHVKYLGVIFDKRITRSLHMEMTEAKVFRTFTRMYSLFKSERLSAKIKLTLRKALVSSCPSWEIAAGTYLLQLQRLQNKILRTIGNFPRCTPVRDLRTVFNLPYVYSYKTKLCRQQAGVIQNRENEYICRTGQGEARYKKYKRLKLGGEGVKLTTVPVTKLLL